MNFGVNQLTLNAYYLHAEQRDDDALALLDAVLKREPNYTFALIMRGIIALAHGDYDTGWPLFELLSHRTDARQFGMDRYPDLPMWDGKPTSKRLFLWASMGRGDMMMMFRFLPRIRSRAPNMVLETHPELTDLVRLNGLAPKVVTLGRHKETFDFHFPLMSAPYLLGITPDTIPGAPYLDAEPFDAHDYPKIGLCCQSFSGDSREAKARNLDDAAIAQLTKGIQFFSLHPDKNFDFLDTARRVKSLDLVVTTDTALANLAGAMGAPTFLMLPMQCCWRWMQKRLDSPWYPSMRLFRQEISGDWAPVIDEVLKAIEEFDPDLSWKSKPKPEETEVEAIRYRPEAAVPRTTLAIGREAEWRATAQRAVHGRGAAR